MIERDPILERPLPSSPETERALLGSILLDNDLMTEAVTNLQPSDFYVPSHRRIFLAMQSLYEVGMEINSILIAEELRRDNSLDASGGPLFLSNLTYGLPHVTSIKQYAKVVRGKSLLRKLVKVANQITAEALEEESEPEVILEHAEQSVFTLGEERQKSGGSVRSMKDIMVEARDRLEGFRRGENPGIPSPWESLNNLCRGGVQETELWGIASLMKMGKSALMKQWAQWLVQSGRRALIFTREMSEVKIIFRMLSALTDIPGGQIRYGLDSDRIDRLISATRTLENCGLFIDSKTSNVDEFRARTREMIRLEGVEIIFGDYLQLFKSGKRNASRADDVGYVWRTMKDTAQDLNTRIVALAQFNRTAFQTERPFFHQVEGSGEGEKAVDVGAVLWTELGKGEPGARPATIFIDYQRDEDAGTKAELVFNGRVMEFHEPWREQIHERY